MKKYKLKDKIVLEATNEWGQLFEECNWYGVTIIHIYFEKDIMTHGYEFSFTLLGLGFYLRYNTDKALRLFAKWDKMKK